MYLPYECEFCIFNFSTRCDRNDHLMQHFEQQCCNICEKSLFRIGDHWYEFRLHCIRNCRQLENDRLSNCEEKEAKAEQLPVEVWMMSNTELKEFGDNESAGASPKADVIFTNSTDVKVEIPGNYESFMQEIFDPAAIVDNERPENTAVQQSNTRNHLKTGNNTKEHFKCDICHRQFICLYNLQNHMSKHHPKVTCGICNELIFNTEGDLEFHIQNSHDGKRYKCELCSRCFINLKSFRVHKKTHLEDNEVTCDICQRNYKHISILRKHMQIHIDPEKYRCVVCDKKYMSVKSFQEHKRLMHRPNITYQCHICDKIYPHSKSLRTHIVTHSRPRNFICSTCGKAFTQKQHMLEHMNSHTGEKPYACRVCNKQYAQRSHLYAHNRLHTGVKPFKCSVDGCETFFESGGKMNRHLFVGHRIYTKKYECPICLKVFPEKSKLKRHLLVHERNSVK